MWRKIRRVVLLVFIVAGSAFLFVGCNYIDSDTGWVDRNTDWSGKLSKKDMLYLKSLSIWDVKYDSGLTGEQLTEKYKVSYSLRQETNNIKRLRVKNGQKNMATAEFNTYLGTWTVSQIVIPKD